MRNGKRVLTRPSKASDVEGLQELFHYLAEADNYSRFVARLKSLPVSRAQPLCSVNYESEMAFVVVVGDQERESVIGNACYYVDPSENMAEVAYMIHPEWQGSGLGRPFRNERSNTPAGRACEASPQRSLRRTRRCSA